jgi:predicted TIM-barrel fold metal-dependent hydrolase
MRYSFDGWASEPLESPAEPHSPRLRLARIEGIAGRAVIDLALRAGSEWDNNLGANYRLWIDIDPIDSHLHAEGRGMDRLGMAALNVALQSAGIRHGVISWQDNHFLDSMVAGDDRFSRLVWVHPLRIDPDEVAQRLANGHVGLKLHPSVDEYPADDRRLDRFVELASAAGTPVAVHSGPDHSDPAKIARLAGRFPDVTFILYHTYLGLSFGKRRAVRLAHSHPNLVLETSWCTWNAVKRLIDEVGPDRVVFGSDAAVDGAHHFSSHNVGGRQSYNEIMSRIVTELGLDTARSVLSHNARRLFDLQLPRR